MDNTTHIIEGLAGHIRVLGIPGSGKTAMALERFRSLRAAGERPAIIVYSRDARDRVTDRLLPDGAALLGELPVLTWGQVARGVAARAPHAASRVLSEPDERILLARVLGSVRLRSDLSRIAGADGLHRALLDAVRALIQNGVTVEDAARHVEAPGSSRAADVWRVYSAFRTRLEELSLTTHYDAPWVAARAAASVDSHPLSGYTHLLVDDFQDVDPGQYALLLALAPPGGDTEVNVFGDPTGARFAFRGTTERFLTERFDADYHPETVVLPARMPAELSAVVADLSGLLRVAVERPARRAVSGLPLFDAPGGDAPQLELDCILADDEIAECQHLADTISRLVRDGVAPDDIAVVARDVSRYQAGLARACRERGVLLDDGDAARYPFDDFVDALLSLFHFYSDDVARRAAGSPVFVTLREHYRERLSLGPRRPDRDEKDLAAIVRFLRGGIVRGDGGFDMARFVGDCLEPLLRESEAPSHRLAAAAALTDRWGRYSDALSVMGGRPDVGEFRSRYLERGRETHRRRGCVGLFSAREVAGRSFPYVFVVGCVEGVFPALEGNAGFLPYDRLEAPISESGGQLYANRDRDERLDDEYRLLLTALTRAQRALHVSAPGRVDGEASRAPSRVLESLAPADAWRRAPRRASSATELKLLAAAAGPGGVERATGGAALEPVVSAWVRPRPLAAPFQLDRFPLSPSSLGTYAVCARRFFYGRVLGVDKEPAIHLDVGNAVHHLLEQLAARRSGGEAVDAAVLTSLIDASISNMETPPPEESLLSRSLRRHLERVASQFGDIESARQEAFRVRDLELKTLLEYGGIEFSGRVDRVDDIEGGGTMVIDYKASNQFRKTAKNVVNRLESNDWTERAKHLQVPLYAAAARAATGTLPGTFSYYVFPSEGEAFVVGLRITDERVGKHDVFNASVSSQVAPYSPASLQGLLDDIVGMASGVFAQRAEFEKTDDHDECRRCDFKRLCQRGYR